MIIAFTARRISAAPAAWPANSGDSIDTTVAWALVCGAIQFCVCVFCSRTLFDEIAIIYWRGVVMRLDGPCSALWHIHTLAI